MDNPNNSYNFKRKDSLPKLKSKNNIIDIK
jgi:hypothetical protein